MENKIGQEIRAARISAGLTQAQLAELCGLSPMSIRRYENGARNPTFDVLEIIASALKVNVFSLVYKDPLSVEDYFETMAKINNSSPDRERNAYFEARNHLHKKDLFNRISASLEELNEKGQEIAAERVAELTKIPEYRKDNE